MMAIKHVFAEMEALRAAGIVADSALGGAVAAVRYIEPAATQDVDVFVVFRPDSASSLDPLMPIYEFLTTRGARIEGRHVIVGDWPVQILPVAGPLLEDAIQHATVADVDGQSVRLFSAEHLAAIALETGRAKGKLRLAQCLEWDGFDKRTFDAIVERNGLLAKWERFQQTFTDEA